MIRSVCLFSFLIVCVTVARAEDEAKAAVKLKAREIGQAVIKEDYSKVVDLTYPKVVDLIGGRDKMVASMREGFKKMTDQGIAIRSVTVDDPSEFLTEGKNTFVIVPTTTEITAPTGKIIARSYLLGISPDGTKTWTFIDGSGMDDQEKRDKVLPKLPEKLKLPEKQKPEFIKSE